MARIKDDAPKEVSISKRFVPRFWAHLDNRGGIARTIHRRYLRLKQDTGADTEQLDLICRRAVFISVQLESQEVTAALDGKFDAGKYTQMVNALTGLLRALGLKHKGKGDKMTLDGYVKSKK